MNTFTTAAKFLHAILTGDLQPSIEPHRDGVKYAVERLMSAGQGPMSVLDEIAAERERQQAKGYTAEHDDRHTTFEISTVAAAVALGAVDYISGDVPEWAEYIIDKWDTRRRLVIAAALLVAEIERLDRRQRPNSANPS